MSFVQEFKEFVMRGNVVGLAVGVVAVGVVIGGAFGKIVTSLVQDVIGCDHAAPRSHDGGRGLHTQNGARYRLSCQA